MNVVFPDGAGNLKSIPLSDLPKEAWQSLLGGGESGNLIDLYEQVPWLNRGVEVRAQTLSAVPRVWLDANDNEIEEDDLPFAVDVTELFDLIEGDLTLYGAAYIFIDVTRFGLIKLRRLHPSTIKPQYDAERGLIGFTRRLGAKDISLALKDVAYIWRPNRRAETGPGASPAKAALKAAGMLHNTDVFGETYMAKGTIMPTIIGLPEITGDDDVKKVENYLKRAIGGVKKAFEMIALRSSISVQQLGSGIGDIALKDVTATKREDVATALGVPQTILFSNAANYATALQDDVHFYSKTILPDCELIEDKLNHQLFSRFGIQLKHTPEKLAVFRQLYTQAVTGVSTAYRDGVIETDEYREAMGYPAWGNSQPRRLTDQEGVEVEPEEQPVIVEGKRLSLEAAEVAKWKRMAINRFNEGKPEKALAFESDILAESLVASIRGALEGVDNAADAALAIDNALLWKDYP